jgi:hypothetical protein
VSPVGRRGEGRGLLERVQSWPEWTRAWLITLSIGCWVLTCIAVWAVYAGTHVNTRYLQSEPGASVTDYNQVTYRALGIRQTEVIVDGDEMTPSNANTVWVVVDLELTIPHPVETVGCALPLVAEGGRTWESETFYSRELPSWCDSDEIKPGQPYHFQLIFQVPVRYADQVYGVSVEDPSSPAPAIVLRP